MCACAVFSSTLRRGLLPHSGLIRFLRPTSYGYANVGPTRRAYGARRSARRSQALSIIITNQTLKINPPTSFLRFSLQTVLFFFASNFDSVSNDLTGRVHLSDRKRRSRCSRCECNNDESSCFVWANSRMFKRFSRLPFKQHRRTSRHDANSANLVVKTIRIVPVRHHTHNKRGRPRDVSVIRSQAETSRRRALLNSISSGPNESATTAFW